MRVGVTGHQELDDPAGWLVIRRRLSDYLTTLPQPLVGLSSLAIGADQYFAEEVLKLGGALVAVLPFDGYRSELPEACRPTFDRLLASSDQVVVLTKASSNEAAYLGAGRHIVEHSEVLIAIWDGAPSRGVGGTADVVAVARDQGCPVKVISASAWRRPRE